MIKIRHVFAMLNVTVATLGMMPVAMAEQDSGVKSDCQANEELFFSAGIRFWNTMWNGNSFPVISGKQVIAHLDSGTNLVKIPTVAVRYRDFGVSASRLLNTNFNLSDGLVNYSTDRNETDLNIFYYVLPSLSVSLGYKETKWAGSAISGPIVALSASAPLSSGFGMYGTGAFGRLVERTNKLDSDYALGEVGLSYSINTNSPIVKGVSATVGYRFQKITIKNVPLFNNRRDVPDTTSGLTVGFIGRF